MPIVQAGSQNLTALLVPNPYVILNLPATSNLNGVPTNIGGVVGSASWGPINAPTVAGNIAQYSALFGPVQNRKYDMGTLVAVASQLGANNFMCVRVTDGTDLAASIAVQTNCVTFTSKYTGSLGNGTVVTVSPGSQIGTFKVVVGISGYAPESFDNVGFGLSGNPLWVAIAAAMNAGTPARTASNLIVASAGVGTTAPAAASYNLSGGTDGAGVTATMLIGQDTVPRTGMYALRNTKASVVALADCDTSTTWPTQVSYGLGEGSYVQCTGPSGDTIANAVTTKASTGIDSYAFKYAHGDWIYWTDAANQITRYVSPQGFFLGMLLAQAPNQSTLNKPMSNVVGTQRTQGNQVYSDAELQQLAAAGIDVITNPCPGGSYYGARFGRNSSSNGQIRGDNYTRMTNYIAATMNAGMGVFIGQPQPANAVGVAGTPSANALGTLNAYFANLQGQNLIGVPNGPVAYSVEIDAQNNPQAQVGQGYLQATIWVQYQSIIEYFLLNITGGQTVQITRTAVVPV
jgi:uncharacterized protein